MGGTNLCTLTGATAVLLLMIAGCAPGDGSVVSGVSQSEASAPAAPALARAAQSAPATPERLAYTPANGPAGETQLATVAMPADQAWENVLGVLREQGLTLAIADERRGIVVATYRGDPAVWLDCGEIRATTVGDAAMRTVAGAAERAEFRRGTRRSSTTVQRSQRLDARLVVTIRTVGDVTSINTGAHYVLTRLTDAGAAGRAIAVVDFRSGERGQLSGGAACQSRGALERVALRGLTV